MFSSSITLILVATDDGSCDDHMTYLLELVFNAMVMVIGLQDLDTPINMERLKQNLKVCTVKFFLYSFFTAWKNKLCIILLLGAFV